MKRFRPVLLVLGILLTTLGAAMVIPALIDLSLDHPDWRVFTVSAGVTLFLGVGLWISHAGHQDDLTLRQAFLLTSLAWVVTVVFAAIPFTMGSLNLSYADAFFEAMSGLTTTGSTVIVGLDTASPGVLMWRALLQWLGGIGIIVMAIAILPMLQVGGMQLFHMESSDKSEKISPRMTQIVLSIAMLYVAISAACAMAYRAAGMSPFDAIAHAMTTVATGGFSTRDASIGHFDSASIDAIATVFMIAGSLPFVLYLLALRGKPGNLWRDPQVRLFFGIVAALVITMTLYQISNDIAAPLEALRYASFNIVSVLTGTGYATTDYGAWGPFAVTVFFFTMFIGGCAGSTSCGIKIFRLHVLWAVMASEIKRVMLPHGVFIPRFGGRPIASGVITSVTSFIFLFALLFGILSVALAHLGLDTLTAMSAAGTALANVGPGLGETIGPAGSFQPLPDLAKWLLAAAMLLGRLELFTVLVMFTRTFWR